MTVAVTGAAGHLGNNLVRALCADGAAVRCLILPTDDPRPLADLPVETVIGDVRDPHCLRAAFAGAELVYHLASVIAIRPGSERLMQEVNVEGARRVAAACRAAGVGRLVHVSSIHALREPPGQEPFDERQPFDPPAIGMAYGRSKAQGTLAVLEAVEQGLDAVVACPTGLVGPHDYGPSEMGRLILDYAAGRLRACVEGAYDFVDVRDVADGLRRLARRGRTGQHYIMGGERISVDDILGHLCRLVGERPRPVKVPAGVATIAADAASLYCRLTRRRPRLTRDVLATLRSNCNISSAKARTELGYRARPLAASFADTVAWFRDQGLIRSPGRPRGEPGSARRRG